MPLSCVVSLFLQHGAYDALYYIGTDGINVWMQDDSRRPVVQAAVQALITKLEPLFPEIAGMGVSSDGLTEAIHGCELRLVCAHEAVLVSSPCLSAKQFGLQSNCLPKMP